AVGAAAVVRTLVLRNQLVLGTINAGRESFEAAIGDVSLFETRWPGLLRRLITGRSPLEEHGALLHGPRRGTKNVSAAGWSVDGARAHAPWRRAPRQRRRVSDPALPRPPAGRDRAARRPRRPGEWC